MTPDYLRALDQELGNALQAPGPLYADFFNIFRYHLGFTDAKGNSALSDPGKRIRSLLCMWSCEAGGGNWQDAVPAAAAVELIHNFSLIHDDIEDNSDARRGRPTVWKVWGLAQGVNAGDAMFVLAQMSLARLIATVPLDRYVELQRVFDSATLKLTQGQFLDIGYERADQVNLEHYLEMVSGKTAALISAACEIGVRIATTDTAIIDSFAAYGRNLGIAFQISDDVLGLWGDPEVTGKSARTDLLSRKKSYPVLAAMQGDSGNELRDLYAKPAWTEMDIQRIEQILAASGAREQALQIAQDYANQAKVALAASKLKNEATDRLSDLIDQVVFRDK